MKASTLLISAALAFKAIYSKAIDEVDSVIAEQIDVVKGDDSIDVINSNNFIYKFHCSDEEDYCNKIKNDLNFAFDILSNTFEIFQPIVLEVYVDDITLNYSQYGLSAAMLAAVVDPNFVPLKTSKKSSSVPYLYPQALAKQLKLNKEPNYRKNDFLLIINNCNSIPDFKNNELRSLLIHEILHGLGFLSSTKVINLDNANTQTVNFDKNNTYAFLPYFTPSYSDKILEINDFQEYTSELLNTELSKFSPFNVFDKYLVSIDTGKKIFEDLKSYPEELNKNCLPTDGTPFTYQNFTETFVKECFGNNLSSKTQEKVSEVIENYFKFNSLGILTKDGDIVPLQTFNGMYTAASSVSHPNNPVYNLINEKKNDPDFSVVDIMDANTGIFDLDVIIKNYDENFILYYADQDNLTVEEMLELLPNNKKHPLIGDGIVKVMKTLGWTTKGKKRSKSVYYVDESIEIPEAGNFEFQIKKMYELLGPVQINPLEPEVETETTTASFPDEEPTFNIDETETTLSYDFSDSDNEIDAEITLSLDQESEFDSDDDSCDDEEE